MDNPVEDVIVVEGLVHSFSRERVLDGVSFTVKRGSVFAVLGRNGAGKTTLVQCLLGQLEPRAGTLTVLGRAPWRERAKLMQEVGVVPEAPDAPPAWRVRDALAFCARLSSCWDWNEASARLKRFGIPVMRRVSELSRGQKAQLQLCLALSARPRLLVLDDPVLGLDAVARRELYEELIRDLADRGTTVLLTSHDLDGVERLADEVAIISGGAIVARGTVEELKNEWFGRLGNYPGLEEIFVRVVRNGGVA
ncbi:MAG: ABC transporter ATP-binding protein [Acidobacteria bacterium]|nr:ABC transporter ATP-binding protein [Acidobacteriota bacterium]